MTGLLNIWQRISMNDENWLHQLWRLCRWSNNGSMRARQKKDAFKHCILVCLDEAFKSDALWVLHVNFCYFLFFFLILIITSDFQGGSNPITYLYEDPHWWSLLLTSINIVTHSRRVSCYWTLIVEISVCHSFMDWYNFLSEECGFI